MKGPINDVTVSSLMAGKSADVVGVRGQLCVLDEHSVAKHLKEAAAGEMLLAKLEAAGVKADCRRSFGNLARIRSVSELWVQRVEVAPGRLDPAGIICTPAGALEVNGPVPGAVFTSRTPVAPAEQYDTWAKTVLDWMGRDAEAAGSLQVLYGAAALGFGQDLRRFVMHVGDGANGKSLFHAVMRAALGEMATSVSVNSLLAPQFVKDGSSPSADVYEMADRRLLMASETDLGFVVDTKRIKIFAGSLDEIVARRPYDRAQIRFRPTFLLVLSTNHMPTMPGSDQALWDRLLIVRWPRRYDHDPKEAQRILGLSSEALAWLIDGARKYVAQGMQLGQVPANWVAGANEARMDADPMAEWVSRTLRPAETSKENLGMANIVASYKCHAESIGERPPSGKAVIAALKRAGYKSVHGRDGNTWTCRWARDGEDPVELEDPVLDEEDDTTIFGEP